MFIASYAGLATLKARLAITGTAEDTQLRLLLEAASKWIDAHCGRHFWTHSATLYYDGETGTRVHVDLYSGEKTAYRSELWVDDLLAITTLKLDSDGDATYEDTLVSTDYILWPYPSWPKLRVDLDLRQGDYTYWPRGQKVIEIAGLWGYGDGGSGTPYISTGVVVPTGGWMASATAIGVGTGNGVLFTPGETHLIDSEQVYIYSIATDTLTVERGVNGTTAASHLAAAIIYRYRYPEAVREACLMTTARLWKRKDTGYATTTLMPDVGVLEVYRGLDPDVKLMLTPFVKRRLGAV